MSRRAAILGLGARGADWAATCRTAGWSVAGFDPDPSAGRVPSMLRAPTISRAVRGADWVICCLPDRLELVQMVLHRAQAEAVEAAVVAVASRCHDIEALQSCAMRPGQVVRLADQPDGGLTLDVTERNLPDLRARAEAGFAELAAIRSLMAPVGAQPEDRESA